MTDDEQESGCDTVDGSPSSDSSGHDSPFLENSFPEDTSENPETGASAILEAKPAVCTVVVPPMRIENRLNVDEQMTNAGNQNLIWVTCQSHAIQCTFYIMVGESVM